MSAFQYFETFGDNHVQKHRDVSSTGNTVVWTPTASMRIAVTDLIISTNLGGSIAFFFGGNNNAQKLAEFYAGGSATISPNISCWESTAIDAPLYVTSSSGAVNNWKITVEGFELIP